MPSVRPQTPPGETAPGAPGRRRVLVVDADPVAAGALMATMVGLGYAVFGPVTEPDDFAERTERPRWDAALIADAPGGAWSRPVVEALRGMGVPFAMLRPGAEAAPAPGDAPSVPRGLDPAILDGVVGALLATSGPPVERARLCLFDERRLTRGVLAEWLTLAAEEYDVSRHEGPDEPGCAEADVAVIHLASRSVTDAWASDTIERLREESPGVPIALLTDREDEAHLREALARGVKGYIPTSYDRKVMLGAIRLLRVGGVFVPASLRGGGDPAPAPGEPARFPGLSARQGQVLALMAEGHPNKIIAHELGLKEATVKMHVRHVMQKLGVTNRTQAARMLTTLAVAAQ